MLGGGRRRAGVYLRLVRKLLAWHEAALEAVPAAAPLFQVIEGLEIPGLPGLEAQALLCQAAYYASRLAMVGAGVADAVGVSVDDLQGELEVPRYGALEQPYHLVCGAFLEAVARFRDVSGVRGEATQQALYLAKEGACSQAAAALRACQADPDPQRIVQEGRLAVLGALVGAQGEWSVSLPLCRAFTHAAKWDRRIQEHAEALASAL
jgi:hypothetical protein